MLKRKTNIFVTILFTFVAFMLIGTTNVNATTVTVTNEQELIEALDGVKEVEGSKITDTDTTVVELSGDITLTNNLTIYAITDLTLDLKGHTIDGKTNSKSVLIYYAYNGKESFPTGSLTIKDTGSSVAGKIISYNPIGIHINTGRKDIPNCKLTIDGGEFYNIYYSSMFEIKSSNLKLDFIVNDGYFESSGGYVIFLHAGDMVTNNITLNVKIDKLIMKGESTRLVYSAEKDFKISDVVSESSNIK